MRNLASILVLVFAFTLTTQAQKKRGDKQAKLTIEQQTTLTVKKMTLALDLSEKQQNEIKPLLMAKMSERKAAMEKRKAEKTKKERPTADEIYAMKNKQLDHQILMKNKMQDILDEAQFEKFEKMQKRRSKIAMHKMKGKKDRKQRKGKKRGDKLEENK
ncbi:hypothetical protein [Polaribacter sp.]|uniref:hypothetical protein n=1 Tax=Polaribacter sp. TaxID=1920175 RepID=UPI003EF1413C